MNFFRASANKPRRLRRKVRDLDLLVIDDVHFLGGKKATAGRIFAHLQRIEAIGRQVSWPDNHPR